MLISFSIHCLEQITTNGVVGERNIEDPNLGIWLEMWAHGYQKEEYPLKLETTILDFIDLKMCDENFIVPFLYGSLPWRHGPRIREWALVCLECLLFLQGPLWNEMKTLKF